MFVKEYCQRQLTKHKPPLSIVGAGLAGAASAYLLKKYYTITIYEERQNVGGLLFDKDGLQYFGPHIFYTDNKKVWDFVNQFSAFKPYTHHVYVLNEPKIICELPKRPGDDPIFRIYSEKAWGVPFETLPDFITARVPQVCTDNRIGYHKGAYKGQPEHGYFDMIKKMLEGIDIKYDTQINRHNMPNTPIIWTGNINNYSTELFKWVGRTFVEHMGELPYPVVNYATYAVPQIRTYDCSQINPYYFKKGLISEFLGDEIPCYPVPSAEEKQRADIMISHAKKKGHWLCGRLGGYRYYNMSDTLENIFAIVDEIKPSPQ